MNLNNNIVFLAKGLVNVPKVEIVDKTTNTSKIAEDLTKNIYDKKYRVAMAISVELMRFGMILSPSAFHGISLLNLNDQVKLAGDVKAYFTELFGDKTYHTLFGDFPNTVLDMSASEMLFHQCIHYWGAALGFDYWPNKEETNSAENREASLAELMKACQKEKYDVIDAGSADDLADKIKTLVSSQQSLTSRDREIVEYFYKNIETFSLSPMKKLEMTSLEIPFKETLCIVSACCSDVVSAREINDVLRIAMFMSGADYTLAPIPRVIDQGWRKRPATKEDLKPWNFRNFSNPQIRQLMMSMENILSSNKHAIEDMKKYILRWIRLGEKLHPMSAKNSKKYPSVAWAFNLLRNNAKSIQTFGSSIEDAKKNKNLDQILGLLKSRPGEFARQIDWIVRTFGEGQKSKKTEVKEVRAQIARENRKHVSNVLAESLKNAGINVDEYVEEPDTYTSPELYNNLMKVLDAFNQSVSKMSSKVIYELLDHFNTRTEDQKVRTVFVKGARKPVSLPLLDKLSKKTVDDVQAVLLQELIKRMAAKEDLSGKTVYLDESLSMCQLPKNMRSTGEAIHQVSRGTRIPLPETSDLLRFYLFWTDEYGREDLDLHIYFYDDKLNQVEYISWCGNYKLFNKYKHQYAQFSGDVRHRRGNCAEYVDVSISNAKNQGARYVLAVARDFNSHGFQSAYAGVMARDMWGTPGEVTWAPNTVENGFKITSSTQNVAIGFIDLDEMTLVSIDEDLTGSPTNSKSAEVNNKNLLSRYIEDKSFFNGLTLLETYFSACGATVNVQDPDKIAETEGLVNKAISDLETVIKEHPEDPHVNEWKEKLEAVKNIKIVKADEFLKDYSKLMDYMF